MRQLRPAPHFCAQLPPQSTSVSSRFFAPSLHVVVTQALHASVAIALPISRTSVRPDSREPRRWIDCSWAAHVAIRLNVRAERTAIAASPARASALSRSTWRQRWGRSWAR